MNDTCKHCGQPESAHHEFLPEREIPVGCVCDEYAWPTHIAIPQICSVYERDDEWFYCAKCEHDAGCHSGVAT